MPRIRISTELYLKLNAIQHRLETLEQTDNQHLKAYRKKGSGINNSRILNRAIDHMLMIEPEPFNNTRDLSTPSQITPTEHEATKDLPFDKANDGRIIQETAEHMQENNLGLDDLEQIEIEEEGSEEDQQEEKSEKVEEGEAETPSP